LDFLPAPVSGIEQPAYRRHRNEYKDNRMELEKQEKQECTSHKNKDGG
jgi:hypothetical protein